MQYQKTRLLPLYFSSIIFMISKKQQVYTSTQEILKFQNIYAHVKSSRKV